MNPNKYSRLGGRRIRQQGVTTLAISLMLLVILSVIVLFSTNVTFFDQRTTINENRARLAEQAAEYAVNLGGEFLKANRTRLISDLPGLGWLDPSTASGTARRWARCSAVPGFPTIANFADGTPHPCMAERSASRRGELYFYSEIGLAGATSAQAQIPYRDLTPAAAELETIGSGGTAAFGTQTAVQALLCRIDTSCSVATPCALSDASVITIPSCRWQPVAGNRIAVTLIGNAALPGERAAGTVKETWGSVSTSVPMSAVPLVASGFVKGLGNAEIVTSPNAGGFGVPVSIWSPENICIGEPTGCAGIGSVSTCYVGEFLKNTPESALKTTCATLNNACGCPAISSSGSDFLSGHSGAVKRKGIDILDTSGTGPLPAITFFPGNGMDSSADDTDDSLFEWIFGVNYEFAEAGLKGANTLPINSTQMNCGSTLNQNCAVYALVEDLGAVEKTCPELQALGAAAEGIYYITDSSSANECSLPAQIGTPENPAIVVVNDKAHLNGTLFYGMLFVRSDIGKAEFRATGNSKIFGSIVVEGKVDFQGNFTLVYDDTAASGCNTPNCLKKDTKFARLPSSWLDSASGF